MKKILALAATAALLTGCLASGTVSYPCLTASGKLCSITIEQGDPAATEAPPTPVIVPDPVVPTAESMGLAPAP